MYVPLPIVPQEQLAGTGARVKTTSSTTTRTEETEMETDAQQAPVVRRRPQVPATRPGTPKVYIEPVLVDLRH